MSLVITGTNLIISLFVLIAFNGLLTIKKIPILGVSVFGVSLIFLLTFSIDFNGLSILLTLIMVACLIGNIVSNYGDYKK